MDLPCSCWHPLYRIAAPPSRTAPDGGTAAPAATPDAGPPNVPPIALEAYRISGEKNITPDLATKRVIAAAGNPRLSASFKLCITAFGTISGVALLKPSGSMAYDRTLARQIYDWKYRPFMLDGRPTPVCTAVTFIYSQASRRVR